MTIDKEALIIKVADGIFDQIVHNFENYVDEDGFVNIDEDGVYETVFDKTTADLELKRWQYDNLYDELWQSAKVDLAFDMAKDAVKECVKDAIEWAKGPMHYYGLKQSDFI